MVRFKDGPALDFLLMVQLSCKPAQASGATHMMGKQWLLNLLVFVKHRRIPNGRDMVSDAPLSPACQLQYWLCMICS